MTTRRHCAVVRIAIIAAVTVFAAGCALPRWSIFLGQSAESIAAEDAEPRKTIYVVSNGWHAGLVVQTADVTPGEWPESRVHADKRFIEIGWGDEGFYRAKRVTIGLAARAVFLPTPSVLHQVGFDPPVERVFAGADIVELRVSASGFRRMCRLIHETYACDERGQPQSLGPGLYGDSHFYRARGNYYYPNTCNVWTAEALRKAGVPTIPAISTTAGSIVRQAAPHGRVLRKSSLLAMLQALFGRTPE
ncbi:MAG: DUF2459 domain-containing protein [Planctomycetaceae bacterium]